MSSDQDYYAEQGDWNDKVPIATKRCVHCPREFVTTARRPVCIDCLKEGKR